MFTEKTKLVEKRDNPFYGSYKENNILEEIHWQNKRKRQQLAMISAVILILVLLSIGITLAITLPPLLDKNGNNTLDPADPDVLLGPSPSILRQFAEAGVSSESDVCSNFGRDIMQNKNGSAVDAAIIMTLCSGLTNPQSSGLGGGLFMVIYTGNETHTVNARETAPINVDPTVYTQDPMASLKGGLAVGVPGELAGLWEAHAKFGKVQWSELVQPIRELAQNGFPAGTMLAKSLEEYKEKIKADPILSSEFINPSTGEVWMEGDSIKRPRLATTLLQLEEGGLEGFYNGTIAQNIVADIANAQGIITALDLSSYRADWDTPFEYELTGNLTLYSLSFPSSGPIVALGLGILHGFGRKHPDDLNTKEMGLDEHELVETLKFAHAHRAFVADPNYADVSEWMAKLLSMDYAGELRAKIDDYKTFDDPAHYGAVYTQPSDSGTTHISIIGRDGDAVSLTTTINLGFGAGFMGNLSGIIFNNQMNDFAIGNSSDIYGLSPNEQNSIEPGKRPASSMAPLILVNSVGQPVLATGGSGGEKVISAVISTTWRALYRDSDIKTAIDYPRFMPTFNPSELLYEYGLPKVLVAELERRGHRLRRIDNETVVDSYLGSVNAVCRTKQTGVILTNADYRKMGDSAGF